MSKEREPYITTPEKKQWWSATNRTKRFSLGSDLRKDERANGCRIREGSYYFKNSGSIPERLTVSFCRGRHRITVQVSLAGFGISNLSEFSGSRRGWIQACFEVLVRRMNDA
jgi:hypothetical protein